MKENMLEFVTDMLLIVLSADLLALYIIGRWYEPNLVILVSELVVLVAIIGFAVYRIHRYIALAKADDKLDKSYK